jgi:ubiquinone biosynthesis protein
MAEPASPSLLGAAVRDLARLRDVAVIVARHGFGELVLRTPLGQRLFGSRERLPAEDRGLQEAPPAVRFTRLLAALGPTYIKLGQILSMRRDLLPAETIEALETLQDDAPVLPFETVREAALEGLGAPLDDLFARFEREPLATASIAQTHRATTHAGEPVVVKVQRPGIEQTMRGDLDLLYLAAQVLEASIDEVQLLGASEIVEEFERGLLRELDFREELHNLLTARQLLDPERHVTVPRPFPELSCRTVLTMQYFEGEPLRRLQPGSPRARHAVEEIVHAACKQVMIDGFFHGDPHAGNILVDASDTLCMLDLGLAGRLTEAQRDDLVSLAIALLAGDDGGVARMLLKMGRPTQRVDLAALRAEVARIRSRYLSVTSLAEIDSAGFAAEFAEAAQRFRIKLAPEYSILSKAGGTIEGIVRHLHPEIDLAAIARPYVEQVLARRFSPGAVMRDAIGEMSGLGAMLRRLPGQLDQILHDAETGNLQVRAVTPTLDELPDLLHQLAGRLGLAAFAGSLTLAAAVVLPDGDPRWWHLALFVGCVLGAAGAWTALFWWQVVGRGRPLRLRPLLRLFRR